jgi:hypothetical protein
MEKSEAINKFGTPSYECGIENYYRAYWFNHNIAWVSDNYAMEEGPGHFRNLILFNDKVYEEQSNGDLRLVTPDVMAQWRMWKVDDIILGELDE